MCTMATIISPDYNLMWLLLQLMSIFFVPHINFYPLQQVLILVIYYNYVLKSPLHFCHSGLRDYTSTCS